MFQFTVGFMEGLGADCLRWWNVCLYEAVKLEVHTTLFKKASNGKYMRPNRRSRRLILNGFYGYKETLLSLISYRRNLQCFLILLMSWCLRH
jgi:hypothetical protein